MNIVGLDPSPPRADGARVGLGTRRSIEIYA